MAKIVVPAIKRTYKQLTKQVVIDLGKLVVAYLPPETEACPNCVWDSLNKMSSGKFNSSFTVPTTIFDVEISPQPFTRGRCPVCYGKGRLESENARNITALVKWNPSPADDMETLPVGREGKALVRIKVLRSDFSLVTDSEYFLVDGVRCELIRPPTIRGLGPQEELVVAYLQEVEVGSEVKK